MANLLLKNFNQVYGNENRKDEKRLSIFIQDEFIKYILPFNDILMSVDKNTIDNTNIVDCSNMIALPGYVDSHTHLLFYGTREDELYMRARGRPYMEILKKGGGIHNTVRAVRETSEEELLKNGLKYLDRALMSGITTIEIKSGYGLDFENEKKMLKVINQLHKHHPMDIVPTFLVHSVPKEMDRKKYIDLVCEKMIPEFKTYTDWFDIFVEKDVFTVKESEKMLKKARDQGYHTCLHTNQISDIGGVKLATELGVRHIDHLEVLSEQDAQRIIDDEDLYAVFLPGAEMFVFSENIGQINQLLTIPERIVLSTDFNPGSSPVLSPVLIQTLAVLRYHIGQPSQLIDFFTVNPAKMLYLDDRGILAPDKRGDIFCLELDNYKQISYLGNMQLRSLMVKSGKIINSLF
ncbi:MAG: imidazolonepropionase [bacterium]